MSLMSYDPVEPIADWLGYRGIQVGTEVEIIAGKHAKRVGRLLAITSRHSVTVVLGELFTPGNESVVTTPENIRSTKRPDLLSKDERKNLCDETRRDVAAARLQTYAAMMSDLGATREALRLRTDDERAAGHLTEVARLTQAALKITVELEILRELAAVCERYAGPL